MKEKMAGEYRFTSKTIMKNVINLGSMAFAEGFTKFIAFLAMPFMAVKLQPPSFGMFGVIISGVAISSVFGQFGTGEWGVFSISRNRTPDHTRRTVSQILALRLLLVFLISSLFLLTASLLDFLSHNLWISLWIVLYFFSASLSLDWIFLAVEKNWVASLIKIFSRILYVFMVFAWIRTPADLPKAVFIQAFSELVVGVVLWGALVRMRLVELRVKFQELRGILRESWPVFTMNLSIAARILMDLFLLQLISDAADCGYYNAALRMLMVFQSVRTVLGSFFLPKIIRVLHDSTQKTISLFHYVYGDLSAVAGYMACVGLFYGGDISRFIFGPMYAKTGEIFPILVFSEFFYLLGFLFNHILFTIDRKRFSRFMFWTAVQNFLLQIGLIYLWRSRGAALANVVTAGTIFAVVVPWVRKKGVNLRIGKNALLPLVLVFLVFSLARIFLHHVHFMIAVGGATLMFGSIYLIFRTTLGKMEANEENR